MKAVFCAYVLVGLIFGMMVLDSHSKLTPKDYLIFSAFHIPLIALSAFSFWRGYKKQTIMGISGVVFGAGTVISYVTGLCVAYFT